MRVKKPLGRGVAVVAAMAAALMFDSGIASAVNEYAGLTYGKASSTISSYGGTATISTKTGDALPTDQCIVVGSRTADFLGSSGFSGGSQVLLDLNCNAPVAAPGNPGNSAASPAGRKAKRELRALNYYNDHPDECPPKWCDYLCNTYSNLCSSELSSALGS